MKYSLNRTDPDFEDFTATLNGELQDHDLLVSADAARGVLVRLANTAVGGQVEIEGIVRVVSRTPAVRQREDRKGNRRYKAATPQLAQGEDPPAEAQPEFETADPAEAETPAQGEAYAPADPPKKKGGIRVTP